MYNYCNREFNMIMQIVRIVIAVATALLGLWMIVRPASIEGFTGLTAPGGRGLTEIRAAVGGVYLVLGAAPILLNSPEMYFLLGIVYLGIGVVRLPHSPVRNTCPDLKAGCRLRDSRM